MSTRRGHASRWIAGVAVGALMLLGVPGWASAEIDGPCEGRGTFSSNGLTIDAATVGTETITVPRSDTVTWSGSIAGATSPRPISGFVAVDLPPPFGRVTIDSWDNPSAIATGNDGVEEYDLGSWVPGGVTFRVFGEHREPTGTCSGQVFVQVEGGPFSSPLTPIALALSVLTGAGLFFTIRPLFRRVV